RGSIALPSHLRVHLKLSRGTNMQRSVMCCALAACAGLFAACGDSSGAPKVQAGFNLTRVTPSRASLAGGARVLVEGDGFQTGMQVVIGNHQATGLVLVSAHALTCLVPPAAAGDADVKVQLPSGATAT